MTSANQSSLPNFIRIAKITLVMTYLVIVAGAVVRMTGSGMGCPDWPKCFGKWIPPTEESQLPANYHEIYSQRGYADTSFNAFHTWTEYINRLIGALDGLVLMVLLVFAFQLRKTYPKLMWYCLVIFVTIGFQGWLGKVVVDSVLAPVKITIHMLTALILIAMIIGVIFSAECLVLGAKWSTDHGPQSTVQNQSTVNAPQPADLSVTFKSLLVLAIIFTLVQVALGTQVRQQIDVIATKLQYQERATWIGRLNAIFNVHRGMAIVVFTLNIYLYFRLRQFGYRLIQARWVVALLGFELLTGMMMTYLGIPAIIQPIHLVLASIIFGLQFYLLLFAFAEKRFKAEAQRIF